MSSKQKRDPVSKEGWWYSWGQYVFLKMITKSSAGLHKHVYLYAYMCLHRKQTQTYMLHTHTWRNMMYYQPIGPGKVFSEFPNVDRNRQREGRLKKSSKKKQTKYFISIIYKILFILMSKSVINSKIKYSEICPKSISYCRQEPPSRNIVIKKKNLTYSCPLEWYPLKDSVANNMRWIKK